jgi:23S rRNA pseudouridine2605 synthase
VGEGARALRIGLGGPNVRAMATERLQKILSGAGVASRRAAERLIEAGRVRVNGRIITELGAKADAHKDRIEVDGRRVVTEKPVYYLLHKPRGVVSTLEDPEGRQTVGGLLRRISERVFPVGRLDYHTSGALLITNDGEMAQALLKPRNAVPKVYAVKVRGFLDEDDLSKLRNGVVLDDGHRTRSAEVFVLREDGQNTWLQMTLTEGKNRQIRRMGDAIGHPVQRIARLEFAGLSTEGMRPGALRPLTTKEVDKLKSKYLNPHKRQRRDAAEQGDPTAD